MSLARVRATCLAALQNSDGSVALGPPSACLQFVQGPLPALSSHASAKGSGIDLPLVLDEDEGIDATVLLCLLQFGSGFREPLHEAVGCGASDAMVRGVLGFLMVGRKPSAGLLAHLKEHEVADIWGLPMTVDEPVPDLPCVTMSKPGPLRPLVAHIARMLNACGRALLEAGAPSFAALFKAQASAWTGRAGKAEPCMDAFVDFLVERFPVAFRDVAFVPRQQAQGEEGAAGGGGGGGAASGSAESGSNSSSSTATTAPAPTAVEGGGEGGEQPLLEVWLLKKAQLCAKELGRKFGASLPQLFGWAPGDVASLTAFADNVLPCVLCAEGVLVVSEALGAKIEGGLEVEAREAALLRAATVLACDALAAQGGVSAETLDNVLWHAGKLEQYRKLKRHINKATSYY